MTPPAKSSRPVAALTGIKPGDRVMGRCAGGFAEYAVLDAREVMPAPERLSWEEAACIPIVFVVVHDALFVSGQLRAGETVLVTAAPSGVGVATLLLAKYLGAKVIGTSRSAEKLERLKAHGLDVGVVTGAEGFGEAVSRVIGDAGVDMVVDNIGADVLEPCLKALAVGGRFVTIGRMSGVTKAELDVDLLAERRLHLYGVSNRLRTPAQRAEFGKAVCRRSAAGIQRRQHTPGHRPLLSARRDRCRGSLSGSRPACRQSRGSDLNFEIASLRSQRQPDVDLRGAAGAEALLDRP